MFKQKIIKLGFLAVAMFMFSVPPIVGMNGDPIDPKTIADVDPLYDTLMTYTMKRYKNATMHICTGAPKNCALTPN